MSFYNYIYNFVAGNIELLRFFYSMLIVFICLIVVIKTDRLFKISFHQGIRYFRNAFFFYGVAFILRYSLTYDSYFFLIRPFFQFFMIMAGFFKSSFFNPIIFVFYIITLMIIFLDFLWSTYYFMFFSQIILFGLASIISCKNYKQNGKRHKFLRLYFIIMILSFFAWVFNFVFGTFFNWRLRWLANVYALNIIVFLIFLYGVIKLTKKQN